MNIQGKSGFFSINEFSPSISDGIFKFIASTLSQSSGIVGHLTNSPIIKAIAMNKSENANSG